LCQSRNSRGFDPSILPTQVESEGAVADEAVLNEVL
jgi:hypothetical protein